MEFFRIVAGYPFNVKVLLGFAHSIVCYLINSGY